ALGAATDAFFDPKHFPPGWYREGDPVRAAAALRAGTGVNVSTVLADRYGLHVGDTIELESPTGTLALPIVGVVPDLLSDRGSVTIAALFDLLRSAIFERRRELAVWRLIGADEAAVRRSIIIESGTVGAIGAVLGVVVGFVTSWIWVGVNFRYLLGYSLEYHL